MATAPKWMETKELSLLTQDTVNDAYVIDGDLDVFNAAISALLPAGD